MNSEYCQHGTVLFAFGTSAFTLTPAITYFCTKYKTRKSQHSRANIVKYGPKPHLSLH